jgi:hypothetical protein
MITDALEHRSAGGADGGLALAVLDAGGECFARVGY